MHLLSAALERWEPALSAWADRYLPVAARDDVDLRRRGRTCLAFIAVYLTQIPTFVLVYVAIGKYEAAGFVGGAGVLLAGLPWLLRRSVVGAAHYATTLLAAGLFGVAYSTGGARAPAMYWTAALPIVAWLMTGSPRAALGWVAAAVGMEAVFVVLERSGAALPAMVTGRTEVEVYGALTVVMLIFVMGGVAFAYELTRKAMLGALAQVNRDMRLVLDNVGDGFVTVGPGGRLTGTRSTITEEWFGMPHPEDRFGDWIARHDANAGAWLTLMIDDLFAGTLEADLCILQLPTALEAGARHYALTYREVRDAGALVALIVVIADKTEQIHAEQAEARQREQLALLAHVLRDPDSVRQLVADAEHQLANLETAHAARVIHTLKGNAGMFGLTRFAAVCHAVETAAQDAGRPPSEDELAAVRAGWHDALAQIKPLIAGHADSVGIVEADLAELEHAVAAGEPAGALLARVRAMRSERADLVLGRLADQAAALASRVGRCALRTEVRHGGERFARDAWAPVWSAMVHAIRNAIDHGSEPTLARVTQGKPEAMRLVLECVTDDRHLRIRVADDGAGIDWDRVRDKARARGLRATSAEALHEALFADGVSTRDEASELSGRGVGLAALRAACADLQATVTVRSVRGRGTTLEIVAPCAAASRARAGGLHN